MSVKLPSNLEVDESTFLKQPKLDIQDIYEFIINNTEAISKISLPAEVDLKKFQQKLSNYKNKNKAEAEEVYGEFRFDYTIDDIEHCIYVEVVPGVRPRKLYEGVKLESIPTLEEK